MKCILHVAWGSSEDFLAGAIVQPGCTKLARCPRSNSAVREMERSAERPVNEESLERHNIFVITEQLQSGQPLHNALFDP